MRPVAVRELRLAWPAPQRLATLASANVNAVDRLDAQTTPRESATQAQPRPRCRARKSRQLIEKIGGPGGVRTLDLMTARHAITMAGVDSKGP